MKDIYAKVGIGRLCKLFGKTRHAFYDKDWHAQKRFDNEIIIMEMVMTLKREMPRLGIHKLYKMLKASFLAHDIKMGRDSLYKFLEKNRLILKPKRYSVKTTDSRHWMHKYPNLIKDLIPTESEQVWVSDITYIRVGDNFNFLSLITDAYSRLIVGYFLSPTLDATGCIAALQMALDARIKPSNPLIHHSDRGCQYCSSAYVKLLEVYNVKISMTENGDPYENALAERVNGILKYEFDLNKVFQTSEQAQKAVNSSIAIYNQKRPHLSVNYLTPEEAHQQNGVLEKKWKPKKYNIGVGKE